MLGGVSTEEAWDNHIVMPLKTFIQHGPNGEHLCIIMPLLGPPVTGSRTFNWNNVPLLKDICFQLVKGMSRGLCHGDFHPTKYITKEIAIIIFGVACEAENSIKPSVIPDKYASPERQSELGSLPSIGSDMWALGCTIAEVLCGTTPFEVSDKFSFEELEGTLGPMPEPLRSRFVIIVEPNTDLTAFTNLQILTSICSGRSESSKSGDRKNLRRMAQWTFCTKSSVVKLVAHIPINGWNQARGQDQVAARKLLDHEWFRGRSQNKTSEPGRPIGPTFEDIMVEDVLLPLELSVNADDLPPQPQ
ncbi:hypothetical protein J7T55_009816 [Diaporthe amygdali]|uniref:uncharacterized protein n=1 Tax=Phomopsis amygdali TaxID=1214568 RepID=UPI0022FE454D|nr:uncharacterized protein J7T55_009816 [Diaporthe amygdali]KAJ0116666.1 hypothetical protein J7T55_009816 [Diaporthe amygdali]